MSPYNTIISPSDAILGDALAPYALISIPSRSISDIVLNVTVEEVHNDRLEVTQHPIQTGAVVTDHSFALPATLTIHGGSSDSTAGYVGYAQVVYNYFLALQATRVPFQVSTGKRLYSNMIIRDLQVTTDPKSEYALMCAINLQQLTFTDVGTSSATSGMTQANQQFPSETGPTENGGHQSLQPVTNGIGSDARFSTTSVIPSATPFRAGGIGRN